MVGGRYRRSWPRIEDRNALSSIHMNRHSRLWSAIVLAHFVQSCVGHAGDWSQFRGPDGLGVSASRDVPVAWGPEQNLAWKTPLPGPGGSSPVVLGDRIFITCYSGYAVPGSPGGDIDALNRHVICLNRA